MARIYKRTDRVTVKVDDVIVKLAPLSFDQKTEVQTVMVHGRIKADLKELTRGMLLAMKYSIKELSGVVGVDDKPYQLTFEGENLTDECVEDLLNLDLSTKLTLICSKMVAGVPQNFGDDPDFKGVEILHAAEQSEKNV